MEIHIIVREGSPYNIGAFLLEHKEILKKNCRFTIHRKSSEQEIKIRKELNIQCLPIIIINGKVIQGETNIIKALIQVVKSFQKEDTDEISDWYQNQTTDFIKNVKTGKFVEENNEDEVDQGELNCKIEKFMTTKKNKTEAEAKTFKRTPNTNVESSFEQAFKSNVYVENNNFTDDELDLEKWMDSIKNLNRF